jgi:Flp pilus assembly protein TadD
MGDRLRMSRVVLGLLLVVTVAGGVAAQGRVGGIVKSATGQPLKGATVTARNPDAIPDSFTSATDDNGRFGMVGLSRGEWTLTAQAPGFLPETGTLNVRTIAPNGIAFVLQKAPVAPSALGSLAPRDLQTQLSTADGLYNGQRWDEAIAAYRAILTRAPALSVINLQIAGAYRNKKEFNNAIEAYGELLKADPTNDKAKVGIAMADVEKGDLDAAEKTLEGAAQTAGAAREVFYSLGDVKLARSKPDEAVSAYQRASGVDPTWGKPVYALGRVAMNRDDKSGAITYFEKVVDVDPMSPEASLAKAALEQLKRP